MNTRRILISALCSLAFGLAACGGDNAAAAEEPVNNPFGGADQPVPTSQAVGASSAVILSSASGGGGGGQTGPVAGLAPSANTQFSTAMYKKWLDGHYVTLDKGKRHTTAKLRTSSVMFSRNSICLPQELSGLQPRVADMQPSARLMNLRNRR